MSYTFWGYFFLITHYSVLFPVVAGIFIMSDFREGLPCPGKWFRFPCVGDLLSSLLSVQTVFAPGGKTLVGAYAFMKTRREKSLPEFFCRDVARRVPLFDKLDAELGKGLREKFMYLTAFTRGSIGHSTNANYTISCE
jgi:hypothetical protein